MCQNGTELRMAELLQLEEELVSLQKARAESVLQRGELRRAAGSRRQARNRGFSARLWARHFPCVIDLTCMALKKQPWWALQFPRQLCRPRHTLHPHHREPGPQEGPPGPTSTCPVASPILKPNRHKADVGEERRAPPAPRGGLQQGLYRTLLINHAGHDGN